MHPYFSLGFPGTSIKFAPYQYNFSLLEVVSSSLRAACRAWSLQGSSGVAFMNLADVWQPLLDGAVLVRLDCARLRALCAL